MSLTDLPFIEEVVDLNSVCPLCIDKRCKCRKVLPTVKNRAGKIEKMFQNRLKNWDVWMERRRKIHEKLCERLNKQPGELVMNSFEELRKLNEVRLRNYYQRLYRPPDPQRGNPAFWKMPASLRPLPPYKDPTHFTVMTKIEKLQLPDVDYVRVPSEMWKIKDIIPRSRFNLSSELVGKERPELDELIIEGKAIHRDVFSVSEITEELTTPFVTVTEIQPETDPNLTGKQEQLERFHIEINGLEISPSSDVRGTRKMYVFFEYDVNKGEIETQYLHMENKGSVTIKYYWTPSPKYQMFADILPDVPVKSNFFFNKNEEVLLSDDSYDLPIWFKAEDAGTFCELWQIRFKPSTVSDSLKLIVVMHAISYRGNEKEKMDKIERHLENTVRIRLLKECLSYVFPKRKTPKTKVKVFTYDRKEIFEAVNTKFTPLNQRVKYIYNKEIVDQLEDLYNVVKRFLDPLFWNLCIKDLRKLTRIYDVRFEASNRKNILNLYNQKKTMEYEKKKQAMDDLESEMMKNKIKMIEKYGIIEDDKSLNASFKESMKVIFEPEIGMISDKLEEIPDAEEDEENDEEEEPTPLQILEKSTEKNRYTKYLDWLVNKLESQTTICNEDLEIYQKAYSILCSYFDIISQKLAHLNSIVHVTSYGRKRSVAFPIPSNISIESYDPVPIAPTFMMPEWCIEDTIYVPKEPLPPNQRFDKPSPENLKDIPLDQCKLRYKTYFNLPLTPPPGGKKGKDDKKGGGGGKDKDTKSSKGDKSEKSANKAKDTVKEKEVDDGYVINEHFDPFEEEFPSEIIVKSPPQEEEEEEIREYSKTSSGRRSSERSNNAGKENIRIACDHSKFVIIYVYLCEAIDAISDLMSSMGKETFSISTVKEIYQARHEKHKKLINIKQLVRGIDKPKSKVNLPPEKKHWFTKAMELEVSKVESKSSLWSLLHAHEPIQDKPTVCIEKPIGYPESFHFASPRKIPTEAKFTSTVDGGVLDPDFKKFKEVAVEKLYRRTDEIDDLEEYIEKPKYESSVQQLKYDLCTCPSRTPSRSFSSTDIFLTTSSQQSSSEGKDTKSDVSGKDSLKPLDVTCGGEGKCDNPNCPSCKP